MIKALRKHIKSRFPEWIVGVGTASWGAIVLYRTGYFQTTPALANMELILPQEAWGWIALLIGLTRITLLLINGTWRRSAHLRAVGSGLSAVFWAAVWGSYLTLGDLIPNLATIGVLLSLDIYSVWFAAEDARTADLSKKADKMVLEEVKRHAS